MLAISRQQQGVSFAVRLSPRASSNQISGVENGVLKVRLCAPPVDGKANAALVKFMAKALGLPRRSVSLASGHKSRDKRLLVDGLEPAELLWRLGL